MNTGADIYVISEKTVSVLKYKPKLRPNKVDVKLESPGGTLQYKGQFRAETTYKDELYIFEGFVVTGPHVNNLLGHDAACEMGIGKRLDF